MERVAIQERIDAGAPKVKEFLDGAKPDVILSGTGWKQGVDIATGEDLKALSYAELQIPGAEYQVEGHHARALHYREIDGRPVLVASKIHPGYETSAPKDELEMWAQILFGQLKDCIGRIIFTSGTGNLTEDVPLHPDKKGGILSQENYNRQTRSHRQMIRGNKPVQRMEVGDIGVITDILTEHARGSVSFIDWFHHLKATDKASVQAARQALLALDPKTPNVTLAYRPGPHFEGWQDKVNAMFQGADLIGMSGPAEAFAAKEHGLPIHMMSMITNPAFEPHTHANNDEMGEVFKDKTAAAVRAVVLS